MGCSGYGLTLSGSGDVGSLDSIKSVEFGELVLDFAELKTVADVNRVGESVPLGVMGELMTVVFDKNEIVEAKLRTLELAQTLTTWTFTDAESSTRAGDGYVQSVGGGRHGTDGTPEFTAIIRPKTYWALTDSTTSTTTGA